MNNLKTLMELVPLSYWIVTFISLALTTTLLVLAIKELIETNKEDKR